MPAVCQIEKLRPERDPPPARASTYSIPKGGSSRTGSLNLRLQTAFISLVSCLLFIALPVNAGPGRAITSPAAGAYHTPSIEIENDVPVIEVQA